MKLERTTTGLIIHQPSTEIKRAVLRYFSLTNPVREYFIYSGNDRSKKPLFGKEHDVIYISSGFLNIIDEDIRRLPKPSVISYPTPKKVEITMNRSPRSPLQEDCIEMMLNNKSSKLTIELKPGTGKEEPYSRKIPTPTEKGYTLMGDLKVGDYVFDRKGNPTKILSIFEQGVKDVYKITFQDGRIALCGLEHLWEVKSHKNGMWRTVTTEDMLKDFKRTSPWKVKNGRNDQYDYKYYIPMCNAVNYPKHEVPIDPWVLGCFIGNGCCAEQTLTISSGTDEIPKRIAKTCGFNVRKNPANYNYTFYNSEGNGIKTKDFFKDIPEMINCYSRDKKIPDIYLYNDVETRMNVVRGLLDTDGSISPAGGRYNIRYTSCSLQLLKQLRWLIYSLGFSTGKILADVREDKYVGNFCGNIHLRIPNNAKPYFFTTDYKKSIALEAVGVYKDDIFEDLLIKDISFSHREECRCIMVDNPEHLYLTEDFIVTHNTFIATYATSKIQMKPLVIAPTTLLKNQWVEEFEGCGIPREEIATSIWDAPSKKLCVVTISSIELELGKDWEKLMNVIGESSFGIKIVDEAHLHLKGVLKLDAICNIKHNWYLSATLGRSDELEDKILNRALLDAERFIGNAKYEEYQKEFVTCYFQDIYYNPTNKLCEEHFKYGTKGLIKATYYRMLLDYQRGVPFMNNIKHMIKVAYNTKTYEGKILVLVPLLDVIDRLKRELLDDHWYDKFNIVTVDGSLPLAVKRKALEDGDLILTTTASVGTGTDIKNLACVINFDQVASPITFEQTFGRLRDRGKECWYFDVADHVKQAKSFEAWGRKRRSILPYFPGVKPDMKLLPSIRC